MEDNIQRSLGRIEGKIDSIQKQQEDIVIMDYKTSELKKQEEADKRTKKSMQLVLYFMAYENIFGIMPAQVQLYFLESGLIGTHVVRQKDCEKLKEKIDQVSFGIRKAFFNAQPSYMACNYCAYNSICGYALKK